MLVSLYLIIVNKILCQINHSINAGATSNALY